MKLQDLKIADSSIYKGANKSLWDIWAKINVESPHYDVEGFKNGKEVIRDYELLEMPDVSDKKMLHLQCHFGLDTLAWARKGAQVTGVDFSSSAIEIAEELARDLKLDATFLASDVYDLPETLNAMFDIVYVSHGALLWLPDLARWANAVNRVLKPGGFLYLTDYHPVLHCFDENTPPKIKYPYFYKEEPTTHEIHHSYADQSVSTETICYSWAHPISEIVTSIINGGLRPWYLHEFHEIWYPILPSCQQMVNGKWKLTVNSVDLPTTFSIRAEKLAQ